MPITLTTPSVQAAIAFVVVLSVTHTIDAGGPTQTTIVWAQSDANGDVIGGPGSMRSEVLSGAALTTFRSTAGTERVKAYAALQTLHPEFAGTVT